jgi:hypothetical protein
MLFNNRHRNYAQVNGQQLSELLHAQEGDSPVGAPATTWPRARYCHGRGILVVLPPRRPGRATDCSGGTSSFMWRQRQPFRIDPCRKAKADSESLVKRSSQ